ncbi:Excreted virulence factor EspC, type VII ESX diderm [Glycomyces sambucus]|uniref:Excreted virulence factor EspC, type VII ESX diderm n=1 Tax=Glycomyces sambucus TaxID=380244 RepID=A0A1G9FHK1_9ACTN|nr:type VII secretion target [Glycomyces sambucus]SDK87807.1 Excreted virulence factor EspC, type VII ESX diderm [Glycomyces sambucus]
MSDQFEVVTDDLRSHASNIDSVRERFDAVLSAIDTIAQDDEAYGIICQFLPPILANRQEEQKELTTMAQENLQLLADAVRTTADDYDSLDEAVASSYRSIEEGI